MPNDLEKITKVHCNKCGHETDHNVIATRDRAENIEVEGEDFDTFSTSITFEMLECRGCQDVRLRRTFASPEYEYEDIQYYPPSVSRQLPRWRFHLPNELSLLMTEVYEALHTNSCTLAIMGVRTLIDMVIVKEVGDHGEFAKGVGALQEKGLVSSRNAEFLTAAFDAGSAAAHRGHRPKISEVNTAMDITENLLQAVYVLDSAAAKLKKSTPPRSPRAKKVGTGL